MSYRRSNYARILAAVLILLISLASLNCTAVYSNSTQDAVKDELSIGRIHPLHVELLELSKTIKDSQDDLTEKIAAIQKVPNIKKAKEALKAIINFEDTAKRIQEVTSMLEGEDERSSQKGNYFLISKQLNVTDKDGKSAESKTNTAYLDEIKKFSTSLKYISNQLSIFKTKSENTTNKIQINGLVEGIKIAYGKLAEYNTLKANIDNFFEVYYNTSLEYNNLRFPYYKNSFCSILGEKEQQNIQIQCAVKNDKYKDSLFLNDEFFKTISGGGFFPRENIKISFDEALGIAKGVNFYEIKSDGTIDTKNMNKINGYSVNFNFSKLKKGLGYIIFDRTNIMTEYSSDTCPVKVRAEVVFDKGVKKTKDIVFVPAYDEGEQICGEDMMYINSKRKKEALHHLQIDDFKPISNDKKSIFYPQQGGYFLAIDKKGVVNGAACITAVKDNEYTLEYMRGYTENSGKFVMDLKTAAISKKGFFGDIFGGGRFSLEDDKLGEVNFTHYAFKPLADVNEEFVKGIKKLPEAKRSSTNDSNVIDYAFENVGILDKTYKFSAESAEWVFNEFDGRSLYEVAFENAFSKFKVILDKKESDDCLDYILLNIYDSNTLLSDNAGDTSYKANLASLRDKNIGKKIKDEFKSYDAVVSNADLVRALASACFPKEVKRLKLMGGAGVKEENWRLPAAGDIVSFDLPEEVLADDGDPDKYLLWGMDEEKKAVYIENKFNEGKTWHYILTSAENVDNFAKLMDDFKLSKKSGDAESNEELGSFEDGGLGCGYVYKISDELFWQLISKVQKTELSAAWYDKVAVSPLDELGYLRYRQYPYYYYTESPKDEVLVNPVWKAANITLWNKIAINKGAEELFKVAGSKSSAPLSKAKSSDYSPRFIDGDTQKGLSGHAFGVAVDMNWSWGSAQINKSKEYFFKNIFDGIYTTQWNGIKNFYTNGYASFVSGAFDVNSTNPNYIELASLKTPEKAKYLQTGTIISDTVFNEYKISITGDTLLTIDLYNLEGDYDLYLYDTKNKSMISYSACGLPKYDADLKMPGIEDIEEHIYKKLEYEKLKKGEYVLWVMGYSPKFSSGKYILDVNMELSSTGVDINIPVNDSISGTFIKYDREKPDDYYKNIFKKIKINSLENYAIGSGAKLLWPLPSTTKNFGNWPAYDETGTTHVGIDFACNNDTGRLVRAVADGTVDSVNIKRSKENDQYSVVIKHDNSVLTTSYVHLIGNSVMVKAGDKVKKGDIVGLLGDTGNSTGSHLHYGMNMYLSYKDNDGKAQSINVNVDPINRDINNTASFNAKLASMEKAGVNLETTLKKSDLLYKIYSVLENKRKEYDKLKELGKVKNGKVEGVEYYEPDKGKLSGTKVAISEGGVNITLPDNKKYAVSSFIIASGKGTLVRRYHWHYVADVLKFREIYSGGSVNIDWTSDATALAKLKECKGEVDYYLKVEVEDIETGASYYYENEVNVNKYLNLD